MYVHVERALEFFKRMKKMVVVAHHLLIAFIQPAYYFQRFRNSSICLHAFLKVVNQENVEGLITHA